MSGGVWVPGGLTELTGDVVASGPGVAIATLSHFVSLYYVDFVNGSDLTGNGSPSKPWKTITRANSSVTASINVPIVLHLRGGNNDTDASPILLQPNISLIADYQIQINQPITITGGNTNDNATFTNISFIGAFSWIRNDNTVISLTFINCNFFNGPVLKQLGFGSSGINLYNSTTVNADFKISNGAFSVIQNNSFLGTTTFEDSTSSSFNQIIGSYIGGPMSFFGGAEVYLNGCVFDAPFGASLACTATANGIPNLQISSNSVPPSISGSFTTTLLSNSQYVAYTPANSANWANPQPTTVKNAIDRIAAVVGNTTPIP